MKIIVLGITAVHHSLVVAYIYLGCYPDANHMVPDGYCDMILDKRGYPVYIGDDQLGNQVYTLGLGRQMDIGYRAINSFLDIMGVSEDKLLIQKVVIPNEFWIWVASIVHVLPLGYVLNRWISDRIINKHLKLLEDQANNLHECVQKKQDMKYDPPWKENEVWEAIQSI
ncbi:MAG: DUF3189 family protein [Chitinophagales bacterium]